jgi:hypothetical protein
MSYVAVVSVGGSIITSVIGGASAKKEAQKQRELQKKAILANLTSQEKLKYEELKILGEVERTKILANSMLSYRTALQEQNTKRLNDTWIYVAGSGLGVSLIYGVSLVAKNSMESK